MLKLSSLPSPPPQGQQTALNLVVYYRQLWEHHQQAAVLASEQMFYHLEALLKQVSTTIDNQNDIAVKAELSESEEVEAEKSIEVAVKRTVDLSSENQTYSTISQIFKVEKGKILHLDYLVWEIYGKLDQSTQLMVKDRVKKILIEGEKQGFWYAVPDSPDCWTLDLHDFPDFLTTQTKKSSSKSQNNKNRQGHNLRSHHQSSGISQFPYSERLEQCVTLHVAIEECLILHYPEPMNVEGLVQWLYPHGLSHRHRKQLLTAIIDTLERGKVEGCKRISAEVYIWNGCE